MGRKYLSICTANQICKVLWQPRAEGFGNSCCQYFVKCIGQIDFLIDLDFSLGGDRSQHCFDDGSSAWPKLLTLKAFLSTFCVADYGDPIPLHLGTREFQLY